MSDDPVMAAWEERQRKREGRSHPLDAPPLASSRGVGLMAKLSYAQEAVFASLSESPGITCAAAIHIGASGRTLAAMTAKGWLTERTYPNGPRVWELTPEGEELARDLATRPAP